MAETFLKDEEKSILPDWKGSVFEDVAFPRALPPIVLVDRNGFIRYACTGEVSGKTAETLFREVDRLVREPHA